MTFSLKLNDKHEHPPHTSYHHHCCNEEQLFVFLITVVAYFTKIQEQPYFSLMTITNNKKNTSTVKEMCLMLMKTMHILSVVIKVLYCRTFYRFPKQACCTRINLISL